MMDHASDRSTGPGVPTSGPTVLIAFGGAVNRFPGDMSALDVVADPGRVT